MTPQEKAQAVAEAAPYAGPQSLGFEVSKLAQAVAEYLASLNPPPPADPAPVDPNPVP